MDASTASRSGLRSAGLHRRFGGLVLASIGGHSGHAATRPGGGLLLLLRRSTRPRGLRQNVRDQEIRLALVGHYLRQTTSACPSQQRRKRPQAPASSPRRTRPALIREVPDRPRSADANDLS
jgi:hypothetical protein